MGDSYGLVDIKDGRDGNLFDPGNPGYPGDDNEKAYWAKYDVVDKIDQNPVNATTEIPSEEAYFDSYEKSDSVDPSDPVAEHIRTLVLSAVQLADKTGLGTWYVQKALDEVIRRD